MLIIVLVLALTAGAFGVSALLFSADAEAVVLEPLGEQRESPFTDSVSGEPAGSLLDYAAQTDATLDTVSMSRFGYRSAEGSLPGIFAGTLNEAACDVDLLEASLVADPDRAAAWAGVLSIAPNDIASYLDRTTPLHLAADARVINHGYDGGDVIARDAVLQRGSAVLVDPRGVPRVDCTSGSPLLEAEPVEDETFRGTEWINFERERVTLIAQAPQDLDNFEVRDIDTGELFARPVGSRGEADRPGTIDLLDDGPIEFDTDYEDALITERPEARYLFDAPDSAVMTVRVDNPRDSEHRIFVRVVSEGSTFVSDRVAPGAAGEYEIILDHEGGAPFELLFSEGPAAFEFVVELATQNDAGRSGDAGSDFATGFPIDAGQRVEGRLGGEDAIDVFLLELPPGHEFVFDAEVARDSDRRAFFRIELDGSTIFSERVNPGGSTSTSALFSGDTSGVLEIIITEGGASYTFVGELIEQADGGQAGDAGGTLADAREVPTGQELSGEVGGDDDADWYLFDAPGDVVEIDVTIAADSDRRVLVRVEDASGSTVASERVNPGATTTLRFDAEPGDEHRLWMTEGRARYTFDIRAGAAEDED